MKNNQTENIYSKHNQREISSFLGHELLFDYVAGTLDPERKKAVDDFLNNSKEAQQDLIKILNGIKYAEQLADTVVSQNIIDKSQEPETYLSVLLQKSKFDRWPVSVKWSIEAMIVVTGIVILLVLVPWDKALRLDLSSPSQEVILAEAKRTTRTDKELTKEQERTETPEFADEPLVAKADSRKNETKPSVPPSVQSQPEPVKVAEVKKAVTVAAPVASAVKTETVVAATPKTKTEKVEPAEEKISKASAGELFRGVLKVTNAAAVTPKMTEKILALGGRKAGEVELGWKKTDTAFYYHFTIPQAKYEELKSFLAEYSKVEIKKESHSRVMPDGIIRLIIQVEEKKP